MVARARMKSVPSIVGAPASAMSTKSQHPNALKSREEIDALADRIKSTVGGPVVGSEIDEKPYHFHYATLGIPPPNYLPTFGTSAAQEYPRSATPLTPFPEYLQRHSGAVSGVHGPPLYRIPPEGLDFPLLPQGDSRVVVPQLPYVCENIQKNWTQKPLVCFSMRGRPGVKLLDALDGKFEGIDNGDDFPFDINYRGITIRMHVGP